MIPDIYSGELRELVQKLLIKNFRQRPDIPEIIQMTFIKRVAEGFIARRGKMQDHVPIKKTTYHKCLKKNSDDNCQDEAHQATGYQGTNATNAKSIEQSRQEEMLMTPAQRARARKEAQARKREQELVTAMKMESNYNSAYKQTNQDQNRSHFDKTTTSETMRLSTGKKPETSNSTVESQNMDSRLVSRKKMEDSFGYNDKTMKSLDINTIESQNLTGIRGIKKSYQTYEDDATFVSQNIPTQDYQRQFNPNANFQQLQHQSNSYSMGEKEIMGDTIDSMNYSGTHDPNLTNPWGKNTGATIQTQYEDTGRYQHLTKPNQNPQQNFNNSYYDHENRPCAGKQNYFDPQEDEQYSKTPNPKKSAQNPPYKKSLEKPDYEEDFEDEFEDDFEEYLSEDEDRIYNDMRDRITDMADPNEMTAVMDIYQDYLENPGQGKLSTIRETIGGEARDSFGAMEGSDLNYSVSQGGATGNTGIGKIVNLQVNDKRKAIRGKLIGEMGQEMFDNIYTYLRCSYEKDHVDLKEIKQKLSVRYGKPVLNKLFEIDQLIYFDQNGN